MLVPLPSHSHYQMRHCESIQHKAEEGGHGGAGGDDPEGGQEGEGLGGQAFAGGGPYAVHRFGQGDQHEATLFDQMQDGSPR